MSDVNKLLGETVRVYSAQRDIVFCEGKVVAVVPAPGLIIEDADGQRHFHASTLPIYVQSVAWKNWHAQQEAKQ